MRAIRGWLCDSGSSQQSRDRQLGQVLPIFAILAVVLLGAAAIATDVSWWWTNEQRMQRAADAAALAGAVYLPGNESQAFIAARAEATKNGYTTGVGGVTVTPRRDTVGGNPRKLIVDVDGPVTTNFSRVFGMTSVDVGVTGAAEFVLPVPMGSPQNYYGVGRLVDEVTTTITTTENRDTGWRPVAGSVGGSWNGSGNADDNDNNYATTNTNGAQHRWRFNMGVPNDASVIIQGVQVRLTDISIDDSATNCRVGVEASWDGGSNWTTASVETGSLPTSSSNDVTFGSDSNATWAGRLWTRADFTNFQIRLTRIGTNSNCPQPPPNSRPTVRLDLLEARVDYSIDVTTTTTSLEEVPVNAPDGSGVLTPQNFWGALQSQGAPSAQGDAYMTYYNTRTSLTNAEYLPTTYYQYAIEFPSNGGEVWLFDPGFCQVDSNKGTGEYYTQGGTYGSSGYNPVSTFYELWNTNNSPLLTSDDTLVYDSGDTYKRLRLYDSDIGDSVSGWGQCDNLAWHNDWVRIAGGLGAGVYRLHTYSTDPDSDTDQRSTTALNAFAIFANSPSGNPRVYGLGAMESYFPLPAGTTSEFYLAQIDAEHAGKTMAISLWDPGDTGTLRADLQILEPTSGGYVAVPFAYTARPNSGHATSGCGNRTNLNDSDGSDMTVRTNTGGSSLFNGCWVNIEIVLDDDYAAPRPSSEPSHVEGGWWKIRYIMGPGSNPSTDLTTWQVELRGNPVHLVPE